MTNEDIKKMAQEAMEKIQDDIFKDKGEVMALVSAEGNVYLIVQVEDDLVAVYKVIDNGDDTMNIEYAGMGVLNK